MSSRSYLQLYLLPAGPCPYLKGLTEQKAATLLGPEDADIAPLLIERGFRRSQGMFYRQRCPSCTACTSVRIRLKDFSPASGFRRILRKNENLSHTVERAEGTPALYGLFRRYLQARHGDEGMAEMGFEEFRLMMEDSPMETRFMTVREGESIVGVMLFDELPDGASAVYSFFEPEMEKRSLGTWMILKLAEYTAMGGQPYLYLGFWIKNAPNMAYKARFQPLEKFANERWEDFDQA